MSAFAAFPWVYACVDAIASDLAGLPLKAIKGEGADAESVEDHPALLLLRKPSSRISPDLFRRQLVTDYVLTGDGYCLVAGEGEPQALLRLAPQRVRIIPWTDGQPGSYEYDSAGSRKLYEYEEMLHFRSPSWEDDPSSLYGTGTIRPLDADLRTEKASVDSAANTATIGRPSGIISPSEDGDRWSAEQIKRMRTAYDKQMGGKSGVLFLGGSANFQQLAWSPRDLEFVQQRMLTRESVLAVFSVPPTRVGLPSANYATAKEQSRAYWQSLMAKSSMIDAELTRLAHMFPDSENVRIQHDFAAVEALQESRTERVQRVQTWWNMGIGLQDAAALEGFEEIPDVEQYGFGEVEPTGVPEAQDDQEAQEAQERSLFAEPKTLTRSQIFDRFYDSDLNLDSYPVPESREERLQVWRSYITRLHGPAERAIRSRMMQVLQSQKRRIVKRLRAAGRKRSGQDGLVIKAEGLTGKDIEDILDMMEEVLIMRNSVIPLISSVGDLAYRTTVRQIGRKARDLSWNPIRRDEMIFAEASRMTEMLQSTTMRAVQAEIQAGLDAGMSIDTIAKAIADDPGNVFNRVRAQRIARTEATRLTNAASLSAMSEARDIGITVYKMWDTAGDDLVRDSHAAMDGMVVDSEEYFTSDVGGDIQQPAASGSASFDVNCRCNLIPFIDRESADEESSRREPFREAKEPRDF
jgi:HK97 family phage portal protein